MNLNQLNNQYRYQSEYQYQYNIFANSRAIPLLHTKIENVQNTNEVKIEPIESGKEFGIFFPGITFEDGHTYEMIIKGQIQQFESDLKSEFKLKLRNQNQGNEDISINLMFKIDFQDYDKQHLNLKNDINFFYRFKYRSPKIGNNKKLLGPAAHFDLNPITIQIQIVQIQIDNQVPGERVNNRNNRNLQIIFNEISCYKSSGRECCLRRLNCDLFDSKNNFQISGSRLLSRSYSALHSLSDFYFFSSSERNNFIHEIYAINHHHDYIHHWIFFKRHLKSHGIFVKLLFTNFNSSDNDNDHNDNDDNNAREKDKNSEPEKNKWKIKWEKLNESKNFGMSRLNMNMNINRSKNKDENNESELRLYYDYQLWLFNYQILMKLNEYFKVENKNKFIILWLKNDIILPVDFEERLFTNLNLMNVCESQKLKLIVDKHDNLCILDKENFDYMFQQFEINPISFTDLLHKAMKRNLYESYSTLQLSSLTSQTTADHQKEIIYFDNYSPFNITRLDVDQRNFRSKMQIYFDPYYLNEIHKLNLWLNISITTSLQGLVSQLAQSAQSEQPQNSNIFGLLESIHNQTYPYWTCDIHVFWPTEITEKQLELYNSKFFIKNDFRFKLHLQLNLQNCQNQRILDPDNSQLHTIIELRFQNKLIEWGNDSCVSKSKLIQKNLNYFSQLISRCIVD